MLITKIFSNVFKKLKIVLVFKNGDSSLQANYRPISILPTMFKIFKRLTYN